VTNSRQDIRPFRIDVPRSTRRGVLPIGLVVVVALISYALGSRTTSIVTTAAGTAGAADECRGPLRARPAPAPPGFHHGTATVDGVRLHYVLGGRGDDVIVLLHGWPENWYEWVEVMPELARDHTVVAVDLPGLGDSHGSPPSYDKKTLAGYVHRLVADELGYGRVHVVGHDFGAGVAFAYAAFHREAVADLTLLDFPLAGPATDPAQLRAQLWWFGFHQVAELPEQLVQGRQRTYLGWFYDHAVSAPNRLDDAAVTEYVRTYCRPGTLHGGFELYRTEAVDRADNTSVATDRLTLPILTMGASPWGDPEAVEAQLRAVLAPLADGPVIADVVPSSGHFVAEENPGFVAGRIRSFVAADPAGR
jgi:pimeloyl-ACP methyl ester carboxylesterase